MTETADIAVIGGGPGGYTAAIRAAQRGAKVVLFERDLLGGVCLNRGCIPSKALIETSRAFETAAKGAAFGVMSNSAPSLDWPRAQARKTSVVRAQARKTSVVDRLRKGVDFLLKKSKVKVVAASARLVDRGKIEASDMKYEAGGVILATGSSSAVLPGLEPDGKNVLDSDGILALPSPPASLVVIGGGAIGSEWASLFASLGTKVEVIEIMGQLIPGADADVAKELLRGFKKRKIGIRLGTKVASLERGETSVRVLLGGGGEIEAEKVLVSVGRKPDAGDTIAPVCGVPVEGGRIPVDETTRTPVERIHAIGDVTGQIMLAHFASHQGMVAAENLTGAERVVDDLAVPACVFTDPEVAWVGYTPEGAEKAGIDVAVGNFPFRALGRAHAAEEVWGFVKIVAEKSTSRVVGFHAVGPRATDLVGEGTLAVRYGLTARQVEEAIHAHPTFPEAIAEAAGDVFGMAIHK
ncbi:MAG: dihydrolipoyl dehydrogenase [Planctomycetota bacterium]